FSDSSSASPRASSSAANWASLSRSFSGHSSSMMSQQNSRIAVRSRLASRSSPMITEQSLSMRSSGSASCWASFRGCSTSVRSFPAILAQSDGFASFTSASSNERSHLLPRQLARLLHPVGELLLVEVVAFVDVEVAHFLLLRLDRRHRAQRHAAEE